MSKRQIRNIFFWLNDVPKIGQQIDKHDFILIIMFFIQKSKNIDHKNRVFSRNGFEHLIQAQMCFQLSYFANYDRELLQ